MSLPLSEQPASASTRPARRGRILVAACLLLLAAAAVLCWRPWRRPVTFTIITSTNPRDGAALVWVPAGPFRMGETQLHDAYRDGGWQEVLSVAWEALHGRRTNDAPPHTVDLDGYWLYRTEVTVAQYRRFCRATSRALPPAPDWKWQDTHPIVNVSWDDAAAYAAWAGAALPTEAQWEKAARGTDGRAYPWGDVWDPAKCVNYAKTTHPVGSIPAGASPYGALDMAGNAWEWCADWYDFAYYRTAPMHNPPGPVTGRARVLRGVSWYYASPVNFRAALRCYNSPTHRRNDGAFRCVLRSPGPHPIVPDDRGA